MKIVLKLNLGEYKIRADETKTKHIMCLLKTFLKTIKLFVMLKTTNPRRVEVPLLKVLGGIVTQMRK